MLLSYRHTKFWKTFHADHWVPQIPTVIRQPFKEFPFSEDLLLRSLKAFAEDLRHGDQRKPCLVSIGDSEVAPRRSLRAVFREKSDTLQQLEETCARLFSKKRFGLMVTQMQATHPDVWNRLAAFLHDARPWIGTSPRSFVDLFYGNYSSTFTGLHKDTQEIIAFVIRGRKRMLAWPFHYFLSRLDEVSAADRYFNKRLSVDPSKYRKDALVLDAEPGDVIYWPSDYWHVSEVRDPQFSAMLSLGLMRPPSIALNQSSPAILSADITERVSGPNSAERLRLLSGFGFEYGGPIAGSGVSFREGTVRKGRHSVILWQRNRFYRRILVAANGHSITLPYSPKLEQLLQSICQGRSVKINRTKGATAKPRPIYETSWSKQGDLKTRKLSGQRDTVTHLIDWLIRVYAIPPIL